MDKQTSNIFEIITSDSEVVFSPGFVCLLATKVQKILITFSEKKSAMGPGTGHGVTFSLSLSVPALLIVPSCPKLL